MNHERIHIPLKSPVKSLCWFGDDLTDLASGGATFRLNGDTKNSMVHMGYRFDAAVLAPSGRYAVIYERLGTKGLVLDRGKLVRELNRSYYHAGVYEYPVVLFEHSDGRTLIAHCPDEYNRIEIEDAQTGERLTDHADREPDDMFHSRLAVSPGGTRLLSAGWRWHPVDAVSTWSIADALSDRRTLDTFGPPASKDVLDIGSATFMDEDRILVSADEKALKSASFAPGSLGVYNLATLGFESVVSVQETIGNMMWLGEGLGVGFYESPKVFDITTGQVVHRWPDISSGTQTSSIIHHLKGLPTVACDPAGRRFAVASETGIDVVLL